MPPPPPSPSSIPVSSLSIPVLFLFAYSLFFPSLRRPPLMSLFSILIPFFVYSLFSLPLRRPLRVYPFSSLSAHFLSLIPFYFLAHPPLALSLLHLFFNSACILSSSSCLSYICWFTLFPALPWLLALSLTHSLSSPLSPLPPPAPTKDRWIFSKDSTFALSTLHWRARGVGAARRRELWSGWPGLVVGGGGTGMKDRSQGLRMENEE